MIAALALMMALMPAPASAVPTVNADLLVTTEWLAGHLDDPNVIVLQIAADKKTFDAGHVPGARFVPAHELAIARAGRGNELPPVGDLVALFTRAGIGNSGRVVLYGDGRGLWAARALFTLDYLGQPGRAALLDGGLEKWKREGRTVETDEKPVMSRPFAPRLNTDVLVTLDEMRDYSWLASHETSAPVAILDARPEAQFTGAEAAQGIDRPGHIPGAVSLFWQKTVANADNPVLRSPDELRQLWERAGVRADDTIVAYCHSGVQASFDYFVARYLGYAPKLYDGSFMEWSKATDTDVAR